RLSADAHTRAFMHGQLCGPGHTTRARSRGTEDRAIRPSVVLAKRLDRSLAALGTVTRDRRRGGGTPVPLHGPLSERCAAPLARTIILHNSLNFQSFCAIISSL